MRRFGPYLFGNEAAQTVTGGAPPLSFDFSGGVFDETVIFTRLGTINPGSSGNVARYYNSSGNIAISDIHSPRIDHAPVSHAVRGLLIEPQFKNWALATEGFDTGSWAAGSASVTPNAAVAPDGNTTADSLIPSSGATTPYAQQHVTGLTASTSCTCTVFMKANGIQWVDFVMYDGGYYNAWFDLTNGILGTKDAGLSSAAIEDVGGGWFRCTIIRTITNDNVYHSIRPCDADTSTTYTQAGTNSIYIWGAELKVGAPAIDSYIWTPNVSPLAMTRSADSASFFVETGTTTFTFDDNSTQDALVTAGFYTIPTNLNRRWIKSISGSLATPTEKIICHGDSITKGYPITTPFWVTLVQSRNTDVSAVPKLKQRGLISGFNYAGSGDPSLIDDAATQVDAAKDGSLTNWLIVFAGTNDIFLGVGTAAGAYGYFITYIEARIAAGWDADKIVVCTMLPRESDTRPEKEAVRVTFNGDLVSGAGTYDYRLARLDLDSNIGAANADQNATYYVDKIHPTNAGHSIIASIIETAMLA